MISWVVNWAECYRVDRAELRCFRYCRLIFGLGWLLGSTIQNATEFCLIRSADFRIFLLGIFFWRNHPHSLTGPLDRRRVVAPSKTCGHLRSSNPGVVDVKPSVFFYLLHPRSADRLPFWSVVWFATCSSVHAVHGQALCRVGWRCFRLVGARGQRLQSHPTNPDYQFGWWPRRSWQSETM